MSLLRNCLSVVCALSVALGVSDAIAQIFGPKNLEECILDKMKGQAPSMVGIARTACLKLFPSEILLTEQQVTFAVCDDSDVAISICAVAKSGYEISRVDATFARAKCDDLNSNLSQPDLEISAMRPRFGSTYKFSVKDARLYQCARFRFYGYKKP